MMDSEDLSGTSVLYVAPIPTLLSQSLCRAMRQVLLDDQMAPIWSRRAREVMTRLREEHAFLHDAPAPLVSEADRTRWWTFGGGRVNTLLAALLQPHLGERVTANNLAIQFTGDAAQSDVAIRDAIRKLEEPGAITHGTARALLPESALSRLSKFQPCLPDEVVEELAVRKQLDVEGARALVCDSRRVH